MRHAIHRFFKYVRIGEACWFWIGGVSGDGYGAFWTGTRLVGAHRFSYELHVEPLRRGLQVRHSCDQPLCVNPDHLIVGTNTDNMRDRKQRGGRWGCRRKLSAVQREVIRTRSRSGNETLRALAQEFGISEGHVRKIQKDQLAHVRIVRKVTRGARHYTRIIRKTVQYG